MKGSVMAAPSLVWAAADALVDLAESRAQAARTVDRFLGFGAELAELAAMLQAESQEVQAGVWSLLSTLAGHTLAGEVGSARVEFGRLADAGVFDDVV